MIEHDPPKGSPTSDDLAVFIGDDVDTRRAELLIGQATQIALSYVDPIPPAGMAIVLSAAARAYQSGSGATSETIGPYSVQRPPAGVIFTKAERADLKRLSGRGGAYSVDPTPLDAGGVFDFDDFDPMGYLVTIPEWCR